MHGHVLYMLYSGHAHMVHMAHGHGHANSNIHTRACICWWCDSLRLRRDRGVEEPCTEGTRGARAAAVGKVLRGADDPHRRRRFALIVRSELDDDGVLNEVVVLGVLVYAEASRADLCMCICAYVYIGHACVYVHVCICICVC